MPYGTAPCWQRFGNGKVMHPGPAAAHFGPQFTAGIFRNVQLIMQGFKHPKTQSRLNILFILWLANRCLLLAALSTADIATLSSLNLTMVPGQFSRSGR